MTKVYTLMSTGLPELDNVIQGIRPGDNVVWQLDTIEDYALFVHPFCRDAYKKGHKLIYFRFAEHKSLIPDDVKAEVFNLHPENGFESFIADIFRVIEKYGEETFYVFDCLSELTVDWYSDRMLGNFFMLTCPYLYDYNTATYFALLRNRHTTQTVNDIHNTAQVVIDVYRNKKELFIQPLKVFKRHSPTMYMLHHWKNRGLSPETRSAIISEILEEVSHPWLDISVSKQDMWFKIFEKAREIQAYLKPNEELKGEVKDCYNRLLRMVVTREEQLLDLARKYFKMSDLIDIGKHMIGTGLVGGKTVGMLLARAILRETDSAWQDKLEPHDSFFIGSDVFYTYLIQSGCWWVRWRQRHNENFLEGAEEARHRMLNSTFPSEIQDQFKEILNYFGQAPIIVRSSSLLEDAYGNSFSGKYESIFCANQGTPQERLENFTDAVRKVYASTMNDEALLYRAQRGLLDRDEQMALLVQRVSGSIYNRTFFPQIAGVGFSFNPYAWSKDIDQKSGMVRLVFGLGTRAVDRHDDDYTRIVALNDPLKKPSASFEDTTKYSQTKVDILNLEKNKLTSEKFSFIAKNTAKQMELEVFANKDIEMEKKAAKYKIKDIFPWVLTFDKLLSETSFPNDMSNILKTLQNAYSYPVDVEFAANFLDNGKLKINLLQCRPFQVKIGANVVKDPGEISKNNLILKTSGPIIGNSVHIAIDRLIYVVPKEYSKLALSDKYQVARLIGKLTNLNDSRGKKNIMLLGPGRWATTTPELGVPVHFGEIHKVSVLCEIAEMHEGLVPDVSLGTHFFNDLVELDMLYIAIHPEQKDNIINRDFLTREKNHFTGLLQEDKKWQNVIKVIDPSLEKKNSNIYVNVNSMEQRGICYLSNKISKV